MKLLVEVGKAAAGSGDQGHAAEDLPVHVDRRIPLIDERLIRVLVPGMAGYWNASSCRHMSFGIDASELGLSGTAAVIGQDHLR